MNIQKLLSEDVLIDLSEYAKNPLGFVLMSSNTGRGKSYVAKKIYQQNTPYKLPAYDPEKAWFINQADLFMEYLQAIERYGHPSHLLNQGYNSKLLILDDLGSKVPPSGFLDFLFALIDRRYNNRSTKGTIITTNLDANNLRKDFGDRIFSRIATGRIYILIGDDRRFSNASF
jgi:DNA replication protein DnaC